MANSSKPGPELEPLMTIFYHGTVNTFPQVPNDKAKAIMLLLAGCRSSTSPTTSTSKVVNGSSAMAVRSQLALKNSTALFTCSANAKLNKEPAALTSKPQIGRQRSQAELPFARKASLARFLEKRKDRVEAMLKTLGEEAISQQGICNEDIGRSCSIKRPKVQHTDS